jgi:hypothetical protein
MRLTFALALVSLTGAISCATEPTAAIPSPAAPTASTIATRDGAITIVPLLRTTPLATSQSVSAQIGALGGRLSLPGAGLTVVIPPLALVTPVTITVTAPAGSDIAYEFSPHGLSFLAPVVATQDLRNTQAQAGGPIDPLSLFVGYFPDSNSITTVTELLSLQIDLSAQTSTALLWHFSGYTWSSGREANDSVTETAIRRRIPGETLRTSNMVLR